MTSTLDRKTYIKDVYSKYWLTARETIYGFSEYDKALCGYVRENAPPPADILEVGIGTGYPFGDHFQRAGYSVWGIDIAPQLIEKCRASYPSIIATVGDAEALDFEDDAFDCTYSFHSTWYFGDVQRVVSEMVRVTRPGGLVVFDVQNRSHPEIERGFRRRLRRASLAGRSVRYAKNLVKLALHLHPVVWSYTVYETPTRPEDAAAFLKAAGASHWDVLGRGRDDALLPAPGGGGLEEYARLVYAARK